MTDAQFEDYAATITGRRVEWQGWVSEVKETDTGFEVYIDMDNPDETFIPVADIIWLTSSRTALTFSKRDPIQFEGTIVQVARPLGHLVITVE